MTDNSEIQAILKDLVPQGQPEENETSENKEIKEKDGTLKRLIVTKTVKTVYVDKNGKPNKLRTDITVTITDTYPDGSTRKKIEGGTTIDDISSDSNEAVEKDLEGFTPVGNPTEDVKTYAETISDKAVNIARTITVTTIVQDYSKGQEKRIKTTVKTVMEDKHPDGKVVTKASEKVSLADASPSQEKEIEAALKDLQPSGEPEVTEDTDTQDVQEKNVTINRTINTKIVKTKYADSSGAVKKIMTVKTVTTTEKYPDGAIKTTGQVSTSIGVL